MHHCELKIWLQAWTSLKLQQLIQMLHQNQSLLRRESSNQTEPTHAPMQWTGIRIQSMTLLKLWTSFRLEMTNSLIIISLTTMLSSGKMQVRLVATWTLWPHTSVGRDSVIHPSPTWESSLDQAEFQLSIHKTSTKVILEIVGLWLLWVQLQKFQEESTTSLLMMTIPTQESMQCKCTPSVFLSLRLLMIGFQWTAVTPFLLDSAKMDQLGEPS